MLREYGRQVGDQTVFTEGGENGDDGEDPKRGSAKRRRDGDALGAALGVSGGIQRPIAHKERGEGKAESGDAAEHQVGASPAVVLDHPLRHGRDQNGADAAARQQQGQREPTIS